MSKTGEFLRSLGPLPEEETEEDSFIGEVLPQIAGGILQAAQETTEFFGAGEGVVPQIERTEQTGVSGAVLNLVRGFSQAATGFIPVAGVLGKVGTAAKITGRLAKAGVGFEKAQRAGQIIQGGLAGAISEQFVFDPHEDRLANFIQQIPALQNPITEALQSDEDESTMEARFKMLTEGVLAGALFDTVFESVRAIKHKVKPRVADVSTEFTEGTAIQIGKERIATPIEIKEIQDAAKDGLLLTSAQRGIQNGLDGLYSVGKIQFRATGVRPGVKGITEDAMLVSGDTALYPYTQARQLSSYMDRVEDMIDNGPTRPPGAHMDVFDEGGNLVIAADVRAEFVKTGTKGLREIVEPFAASKQLDDFMLYAASLRVLARKQAGRTEATLLDDQAQGIVDEIRRGPNQQAFEEGVSELRRFGNDMLEYLRKSEVLDDAQVKALKDVNIGENFGVYVPINYVNKNIARRQAVGQGGAGAKGIKALRGLTQEQLKSGEFQFDNFLEGYIKYVSNVVRAGDLNRAKNSLYRTINKGMDDGTLPELIRVVPLKAGKGTATTRSIFQAIENKLDDVAGEGAGADYIEQVLRDIEAQTGIKQGLEDVFDNTLPVVALGREIRVGSKTFDFSFDQGKPVLYEILDKDLVQSVAHMGLRKLKDVPILNKVSKLNRLYSSAITHSPGFFTVNFGRDTISATINSEFRFIPIWSSVKGLKTAFQDTEFYREVLRNGGGFSSRIQVEGLGTRKKFFNLADEIKEPYLKKIAKKVGGSYQGFVQNLEMAARLAEAQMAQKAGVSPVGSAFLGREVSTDFSMKGASKIMQHYNANTAFFNAGLQGIYRAGRRAVEAPAETAVKATALLGLPAMGLWAINSEFEEYDEVPDHLKETMYILPNISDEATFDQFLGWILGKNEKPTLDKDVPFIALPKPYDFGQVATWIEGGLEAARSQGGKPLADAFGRSIVNTLPGTLAPTLLQPFWDISRNENFFGAQIVPPYMMDGRLPQDVKFPTTSSLAELISMAAQGTQQFLTGISPQEAGILTPLEAEYLIDQFTPGLADLAQKWVETTFRNREFGELPVGQRGAQQLDNNPFAAFMTIPISSVSRRFLVQNPPPGNPLMEEFWNIKQRADAVKGSDKHSEKQFWDITGLQENFELNSEQHNALRAVSPLMNRAAEMMRMINNISTITSKDPNLTGEEKQKLITNYNRQKTDIATSVVKQLKSVRNLQPIWDTVFGTSKTGFVDRQEKAETFTESQMIKLGLK